MRYCSASAVRNLTLFSLVVLSSHSFVLVNADGSSTPSTGSDLAPSVPPSSPAAPPPSSTPSSSSQPSTSPASQSQPPSVASSSSPSSSASASQSSASSSASQSSSTSAASSSSSGTASSSSSSSTVSLPSSALSNTLTVTGISTPAYPTGAYNSYSYSPSPFVAPSQSFSSDASSQTAVGAAADKSFKDNKGAVTAVAIMASLVGVGILGFIIFKVLKRRSRLREEEEEMYFEKYAEPPLNNSGPSDSSYNISSATQPAAHNAYPDRAYHYGTTGNEGYGAPQQYEYPPGTAYAAAAQGAQYQYHDNGGGYGAAASGNHPYAHPQNNYRPTAAPPVNTQEYEPRTDQAYAQ